MKKYLLLAGLLPLVSLKQMTLAQTSPAQTVRPSAGEATGHFTISGRLGHYNAPAIVYFDHMEGDVSKSDSAVLVDGNFTFSGKLDGPAAVRMAFTPRGDGKERAIYTGDVKYFYIGKENITIQSSDSLLHAAIGGSPLNDQFESYIRYIGGTIMVFSKEANEEFNSANPELRSDTSFAHQVDHRFREKIRKMNEKELLYARSNPNSFFSLVALSELTGSNASAMKTKPVFDSLDEGLRNSFAGKELAARITALSSVVVGNMAPDFTENDLSGRPVTLSALRGHYVLVDFWASWCGPCRAENPNLIAQYGLYKDKGFQVLSVSLDDNKAKWQDAVTKDGMPWLHVSDLQGWNNHAGKLYGVRAVPSSFLIDPQGKIIATGLRGDELDKKLGEIFQ